MDTAAIVAVDIGREDLAEIRLTQEHDVTQAVLPESRRLGVWGRLITYVEDDATREVALNGPDTSARTKEVVPFPAEAATPTEQKADRRDSKAA